MPFSQPHSVPIAYQFAVKIIWRGIPECPHQQYLTGCRFQQIGAADNLCYSHHRVVDYDRKLISGNIVAPPYQEVAEITPCNVALLAEIQIAKRDLLAIRCAEPPIDTRWLLIFSTTLAAAGSRIHRLVVGVRVIRGACGLRQVPARTGTRI